MTDRELVALMAATIVCPRCGGSGQLIDPRHEGRAFRARREKRGFTLRGLAVRVGISPAYLSDLELGKRNWSEPIRARLRSAMAGK